MGPLDRFSAAARAWFTGAFAAPTAAQEGAWESIARGDNTLVVAPTGAGKTLAAFLGSLDRLAFGERHERDEHGSDEHGTGARGPEGHGPAAEDPERRCRVLYVSPLKALAVDVERNLRAPLTGIRQASRRLGLAAPDVRVGIRSGDTP